MQLVTDLTPTNLFSEKEKFFANPTKNPQFQYVRDFSNEELHKYGLPLQQVKELAEEILQRTYREYSEDDLHASEGRALTQAEVTTRTVHYLHQFGLHTSLQVRWSNHFLPRTSISGSHISFRLPCIFHEEGFQGMLYHEIGTHALRRFNSQQQPWNGQKKKYGFSSYLKTEEGLATLHGQLAHSVTFLHAAAIKHYVVSLAQSKSFVELWEAMANYVSNFERRWIICTKAKRGVQDTSLPGGFTKDLVYLEGAVDVFHWLSAHDYNVSPLYYGKISLLDIERARASNPNYVPLLPDFYVNDQQHYAERMEAIAKKNSFEAVNIK